MSAVIGEVEVKVNTQGPPPVTRDDRLLLEQVKKLRLIIQKRKDAQKRLDESRRDVDNAQREFTSLIEAEKTERRILDDML